jgi:excisionase family DNA binding protein
MIVDKTKSPPKRTPKLQCSDAAPPRLPLRADQIYSIADGAAALNISQLTVFRAIKAGDMPVVKVGRRTLLRGMDLIAFVEARIYRRTAA